MVAIAGSLLTWLLWPSPAAIPGADRVRQYLNVRACLLTGPSGLTGGQAAATWAGMEDASAATRAMVSYLAVPGPATPASTVTYLASLVQRQCGVIVAIGPAPVAAVTANVARYRQVRFVVISAAPAAKGVTGIAPRPAAQLHSAVAAAVTAALSGD